MRVGLVEYAEVWAADFEFTAFCAGPTVPQEDADGVS